jgi:hypothetical protein
VDDYTENDPWEPFYGSGTRREATDRTSYPPQKGHMVSCFTALCKLSTILSTIMFEIYGSSFEQDSHTSIPPREKHSSKNVSFIKISSAIQRWWVELPEVIRLNVKNLPNISPPLHIVSLNLLYHTTLILLHRPFILGTTEFDSHAVARSYQSTYYWATSQSVSSRCRYHSSRNLLEENVLKIGVLKNSGNPLFTPLSFLC